MTSSLTLYIGLVLASDLWAYPSLFFTKKEINLINKNYINKKNNNFIFTDLYLGAIIYVDKDHWCLWANNSIVRSKDGQTIKNFQIIEVTAQMVRFLLVHPHSGTPLTFTLRPNQTYLMKENRIIHKL